MDTGDGLEEREALTPSCKQGERSKRKCDGIEEKACPHRKGTAHKKGNRKEIPMWRCRGKECPQQERLLLQAAYVTVQRKGIPPTGKAISTNCICDSAEERNTPNRKGYFYKLHM